MECKNCKKDLLVTFIFGGICLFVSPFLPNEPLPLLQFAIAMAGIVMIVFGGIGICIKHKRDH